MRLSYSLILLCALLSFANITKADISDAFNTYTSTPTTTFSSQQMQGVTGGSFHARVPQVFGRQMFSVQAPTWDAGCGGIDLFAGAFSVITKDELVQMARAIAQGAPGYFFNLAIDSVCPTCGANMKELAKRLNQYNEMVTGSCEQFWDKVTKTDVAQSASEKINSTVNTVIPLEKTFNGLMVDMGFHQSEKSSDTQNGSVPASVSAADAQQAMAKNIVFELFRNDNAKYVEKVDLDLTQPELFMTLIGRAKVDTAADATSGEVSVDTLIEGGSAKLQTLMYGADAGDPAELTLTKCASSSLDCMDTIFEQIPWKGLIPQYKSLVSNISTDPDQLGILQRMNKRANVSEEQKQFIMTFPFDYIDYAKTCNIGAADSVAQLVASKAAFDAVGKVLSDLVNDASLNILNNDVAPQNIVSTEHVRELIKLAFDHFLELQKSEQQRIVEIQNHLTTQLAFSTCKDNRV